MKKTSGNLKKINLTLLSIVLGCSSLSSSIYAEDTTGDNTTYIRNQEASAKLQAARDQKEQKRAEAEALEAGKEAKRANVKAEGARRDVVQKTLASKISLAAATTEEEAKTTPSTANTDAAVVPGTNSTEAEVDTTTSTEKEAATPEVLAEAGATTEATPETSSTSKCPWRIKRPINWHWHHILNNN